MCQIDEIVFFKTKMDLTSDFVSFQNAPLFQVLDNKLLSNMAAFWELVESGWESVIKAALWSPWDCPSMSAFYYESLQCQNQSVSHSFTLSGAKSTSYRSCLLHFKQTSPMEEANQRE